MKKKSSFFTMLLYVIGISLAVFVSYRAFKEAYRNKNIERQIEDLKRQAEKIKGENNELSQKISYFDTDQFRERIAREKLNMQKPNERVLIVKPSGEASADNADTVEAAADIHLDLQQNYKKWLDVFFAY